MSAFTSRITPHAPVARSLAIAALLGTSFLASPLTVAYAAETSTATAPATPHHSATNPTRGSAETVEQRITTLHAELKITGDEEAKWNGVAQAMRENAAAMEKLAADKAVQAPQSMTAIDDLNSYEKFAQAHVDGLKNLISAFQTLYVSFPDPQKKIADKVFQSFGQKGRASHT